MRLRSLKPMGLMPDFESDIWALTVDIADDKGLRITPTVVDRRNARGMASAIDLELYLVERLADPTARARIATQMEQNSPNHRSYNLFKFTYDSLACQANSRRGGTHI
jgi:hypothetical protein